MEVSGNGGYWTCPVTAIHAIAERFPAFARTAEVAERLKQPAAVVAQPAVPLPQMQGTWTRTNSLRTGMAVPSQPVRGERPLGTIALEGNEIIVRIERLWEVDRAQALRVKDQCKAYCNLHGGRGYDPGARAWRIDRAAALALTKVLPTFHQTKEIKSLASEQLHRICNAA